MASPRSKTEQYQALPAKVSQQVLRELDKNWPSFFAASSEFKSHPDKFLGKTQNSWLSNKTKLITQISNNIVS
jgi:hypothetical protein